MLLISRELILEFKFTIFLSVKFSYIIDNLKKIKTNMLIYYFTLFNFNKYLKKNIMIIKRISNLFKISKVLWNASARTLALV